jgi:cytochrome c553
MTTRLREPLIRFVVKHPWATLAALTAAAIVGAAVVVISGVVPIKASSGHWPITAKFLDFAKLQSVATYSLGTRAPSLDDEAMLIRGASHYERGCYPCHGGPGGGVPPVMAAMTPDPPQLPDGLAGYKPEELFYIVKHGIKFTGMPAWPALQRDDEVWAVVAFLRKMPEIDAAEYRRLAYGEPTSTFGTFGTPGTPGIPVTPRAVRDICWRCHGVNGTGRGPGAFPSLAGQRAEYLYASLRAYADRRRFSGIMASVAAGLSDETMREVAQYYASLPPREAEAANHASAIARGRAIAMQGVPERDIPACVECHGPTDIPKNPAYPRLTGQYVQYLALQLDLLRLRRRGGSPNVALMHVFVDRLDAEQIRSVTLYYGSGASAFARETLRELRRDRSTKPARIAR